MAFMSQIFHHQLCAEEEVFHKDSIIVVVYNLFLVVWEEQAWSVTKQRHTLEWNACLFSSQQSQTQTKRTEKVHVFLNKKNVLVALIIDSFSTNINM